MRLQLPSSWRSQICGEQERGCRRGSPLGQAGSGSSVVAPAPRTVFFQRLHVRGESCSSPAAVGWPMQYTWPTSWNRQP